MIPALPLCVMKPALFSRRFHELEVKPFVKSNPVGTERLINLRLWQRQAGQNNGKFELVESHRALGVERGLTIIDYM